MTHPAGSYASPIPNVNFIKENRNYIFRNTDNIDYNFNGHLEKISEFNINYEKFLLFPENKNEDYRYYTRNDCFGAGDAFTYFNMLLLNNPKNVLEIGSGYSTAILLDFNNRFRIFGGDINITTIDRDVSRLISLKNTGDTIDVIEAEIQEVNSEYLDNLISEFNPNDILFIDSSHIIKTGSDLQRIYFEIIPKLPKGALIHIHDIFEDFEYPDDWVLDKGWYNNEAYIVRALLQNNNNFKIEYFNDYVFKNLEKFEKQTKISYKNIVKGGSLWLRKMY